MIDFQLGVDPRELNVNLSRHSDFAQTVRMKDGLPFPGALQIRFSDGTVFAAAAVGDGSVAEWAVDKADVDDVLEAIGDRKEVALFCGDAMWAEGRVIVHG